jgi:hypothetical protein
MRLRDIQQYQVEIFLFYSVVYIGDLHVMGRSGIP